MPASRTRTLTSAALAASALLAAAALPGSAAAATPEQARALAATNCSGIAVAPDSRTVRRKSRVRLEGRRCGSATYASGAGPKIRVSLRKGKRWATVAKSRTDEAGRFSVCVPVRAAAGAKSVAVRVATPDGATGKVKLRVSGKGARACSDPSDKGNPNCPLYHPGTTIGMTLPTACTVVASDTAANADPMPFWGSIECGSSPSTPNPSRHQRSATGGDPAVQGTGYGQADTAFRRLTVFDGDDFYGERCELGLNENRGGPVAFYNEGQRRATYFSVRLPDSFPLDTDHWQGAIQMKQAMPANAGNGAPVLSLAAFNNEWRLFHGAAGPNTDEGETLWTVPAQKNQWTRFAWDVTYSQDPAIGSVTVYVDLNADGDFGDSGEQSPQFRTHTLKREVAGPMTAVTPGASIPSHLRVGMYHDPAIPCPSGCAIDVDNIQVVKP